MSSFTEPPPIIHSAKVLCYAQNDDSIEYTGRIHLVVGRPGDDFERVGEMPRLAICKNYGVPEDYLLFFCDEEWEPKGTIGFDNLEDAKGKAERGYKDVTEKWINYEISESDLDKYIAEELEADPNTDWWKTECFICGKDCREAGKMIQGKKGYICDDCIKTCYEMIMEEDET